jgi:HTH-type transcriptional regulator, sugar sensing transcriptional regulator
MNYSAYVKIIKELGLTEYEAKCYLALFERESLTVIEIEKLAGIPRPNAYETMKKLLAKGLCSSIPGKIKRYSVSDPMVFCKKSLEIHNNSMDAELENLKKRQEEILDMKTKEIFNKNEYVKRNIEKIAKELQPLYEKNRSNSNPLEYIEILKNSDQTYRKLLQLFSEAKKEILGFTKPPFSYANVEQLNENIQVQAEARRRGVKIKVIYQIPTDETEKVIFLEKLHKLAVSDKNHETKIIERLPMKMVIVDERIVLNTLDDPIEGKSSMTSLATKHDALAESLKVTFESFWEKARNWYILNNRKYYIPQNGKEKKSEPIKP